MSNENRSLLPPNATAAERAIESAMAKATDVPVPIATLWDPQRCPVPLLPWLAWAMSVDDWDSAWPDSIKRSLIAGSFRIHRIKGTVAAIRQALAVLGVEAELAEWFEYGGRPHTFRLTAWANANLHANNEAILSPALYTALKRAVDAVKPVRSHYDFRVGARFDDRLAITGIFRGSQTVRQSGSFVQPPIGSLLGRSGLKAAASATAAMVVRTRMETSL